LSHKKLLSWHPRFGHGRGKRPFLGNQSSHGKPPCETCHKIMVSEKSMFLPMTASHMKLKLLFASQWLSPFQTPNNVFQKKIYDWRQHCDSIITMINDYLLHALHT
jgi:hypothetical protein